MKNYKYHIGLAFVLNFFMIFISCEDEKITNDNLPDQLFRPTLFTPHVNANDITFTWVPIKGASYSLEISRDSLQFQQDLQVFSINESKSTFEVKDLWGETRYSARIKSVSNDPGIKDSEYKQITFMTGAENIFYTVANEDIGINSILLKWVKGKDVSHIVVSTAGVDDRLIVISPDDISAGEKLIGGLNPGTAYTFKIYLGTRLRGTINTTTKK